MGSQLLTEYTRHLRHHGVDIMSGTGGVVSAGTRICINQLCSTSFGTELRQLPIKPS